MEGIEEEVRALVRAHAGTDGPLLPLLHAVQARFGHVPRAAIPVLAEALNLTRAEVHGVASFYHDFRADPPGRHVIRLCRAEACQSLGARELEAHLRARLGIGFGQTTPDGAVTLEAVYCLGHCAAAPSLSYDGAPYGRMTPAACDALVAMARR